MKIRGIDYVFYNITDLKKSLDFYRDILGLKVTKENESWAELDLGNLTLAIGAYGASTDPNAKKNSVSAALAVDDLKKGLEYLKSKNVKVTQDLFESDPCFMAIILDPDNNEIILHQRKDGTVG